MKLDAAFLKKLEQAEVVFVGRPTVIDPSPGVWSGRAVFSQRVVYRVLRTLKGTVPGGQAGVAVLHPLVAGSKTADPSEPKLNAQLFRTDQDLILLARLRDGKLVAVDENWSASVASEEREAAVKQQLSTPPAK